MREMSLVGADLHTRQSKQRAVMRTWLATLCIY